ncbi:hypothetical protein HNR42_001183 [Deinobacterium chartae]|uniref:Peptidase C39-like domain-containing protein n=1 Tax=Deinobacterium chartae TaxID=521158 RepID=A0A841HXZ5_9DEIO|nr:C39 family peptidase [Deinobacterium chartae]MBB6097766.1 hypothetical protein [Deinobacterium chartae]
MPYRFRAARAGLTLLLVAAGGLAAAAPALPARAVLPGLHHEYQRLNNCGPVTALMTLSLFGKTVAQPAAAAALKEDARDRNVTVPEMARYLERFGLRTAWRFAGTPATLKHLIAAGVPVILHQQMKTTDDIGHYRVVYGYGADGVYVGDSYLGPKVTYPDAALEKLWRPYNGEYLVVYRPDQQAAVQRALGKNWNRRANWRSLEASARARLQRDPQDAFAWWGLGQARAALGAPRGAADAFLRAHRLGLPEKHYWYQQDALEAWNRVGRYDLTLKVATRELRGYPNSTELLRLKAEALQARKRSAQR